LSYNIVDLLIGDYVDSHFGVIWQVKTSWFIQWHKSFESRVNLSLPTYVMS